MARGSALRRAARRRRCRRAFDNQGHTPRRGSALLEYDTSEFGRFRVQYSRDDSDVDPGNVLLLQYTAIFGPHGAHNY